MKTLWQTSRCRVVEGTSRSLMYCLVPGTLCPPVVGVPAIRPGCQHLSSAHSEGWDGRWGWEQPTGTPDLTLDLAGPLARSSDLLAPS